MPIAAFELLDDARKKLAYQKAAQKLHELKANAPLALGALQLELLRRKLRDYKSFVQYFWEVLEPTEPLVWNWHLDELCAVMDAVERGDTLKEIFNVPPGTMKSLLISVFFRARVWARDPSKRFLAGSHGSHLSIRDNTKLRTLIQHSKYQQLYPHVKLTGDQNAKEKFETTKGGWSIATSVGGVGTGEHPDFTIIDDPLTEQQSRSKADRDAANNWIDRTLSTRGVTRDMATVLIMQRLHEDDPTGHLLRKGGWHHVCFPMRFIGTIFHAGGFVENSDPLDHRTVRNALLWPELFPEHKVRALEIALGPYGTAGQLQQKPAPEGGGLFKREWLKFIDAAPILARRARGWDTAASEGEGDYTAGVKIAMHGGLYYIENVLRDQWSPAAVDIIMSTTARSDGTMCSQREEREPGGSGKTVTSARAKTLRGYDYAEVIVSSDKVTRARPFRAQCEAGNVFIVRSGNASIDAWIEPYIAELCAFPTGMNEDQVDASSCAFNAVLLEKSTTAQVVKLKGF